MLVGGICLAFVFGMIAQKLRLSPLFGHLVAGVVAGPFTPGFVADMGIAQQLSEIGVILIMFGVGLRYSIGDLVGTRKIVIPGRLFRCSLPPVSACCWVGCSAGSGDPR
jgi:CPA2 family monovalent cation:H+ antiporter-2